LRAKIEKVEKSCNIKFLETAQNIELHIFWLRGGQPLLY